MAKGYRWYINADFGEHEPVEKTFDTLKECEDSISEYADTYPVNKIGIDLVEDDDGFITVIKSIKTPIEKVFYE